jgi:hypothetical protein
MSVVVRALATMLLACVLALLSHRGGPSTSGAAPRGEPAEGPCAPGPAPECRWQDVGCGPFSH